MVRVSQRPFRDPVFSSYLNLKTTPNFVQSQVCRFYYDASVDHQDGHVMCKL